MKKIFFSLCLLFLIFMTSGCIKDDYTIKIDNNDKVTVTETIGIENDTLDTFKILNKDTGNKIDVAKKIIKPAIKKNFEVISYTDDNYTGIIQTKDGIDLKNFNPEFFMLGLSSVKKAPVIVQKGLFRDRYIINLKYDRAVAENLKNQPNSNEDSIKSTEPIEDTFVYNSDGTTTVYQKEGNLATDYIMPKPDMKLKIQIPVKALKHNATNVISDNLYEWNLYTDNPIIDINIEYKKFNNNLGVALIFVFLLVFILFLGIYYSKLKNNIPM